MRILLVKTSSLGDVIHNLPVVSDLRRQIPEARIDWCVEENFAALPRLHPGVDRVIPVAVRRWRKALCEGGTWREMRAFRQALRSEPYDAILDTQGLIKSALIARQARGPRLGYAPEAAREPLAARLYDRTFGIPKAAHAVERNRWLAAAAFDYPNNLPLDYGIAAAPLLPSLPHSGSGTPLENRMDIGFTGHAPEPAGSARSPAGGTRPPLPGQPGKAEGPAPLGAGGAAGSVPNQAGAVAGRPGETARHAAGWLPAAPYAVFLTATSRDDKLWEESRWIALGRALAERGLRAVLPAGNASERERAVRLAAALPGGVAAPPLGLEQLAGLLAGARLTVGVDTGLTHLSAALTVPTVALYTATEPGLTGVLGTGFCRNLGGPGRPPEADAVLAMLRPVLG